MPGIVVPSASAMQAMVDAVPIVLQCPRLRIIDDSDAMNVAVRQLPARTCSLSRHTSVPQPSGLPRNVPVSIGPPGTTTAGRSTDAAAISSDGMVLSQPPSSTTPSTGLARSISSVAIAAMLRQSMAVGLTSVSPSETTGRFIGTPPASQTPCLTLAATSLRCELHGVEIRGGVGDRDVRPPVEGVRGQSAAHPGPVDVGVPVSSRVPLGCAAMLWHGLLVFSRRRMFPTCAESAMS